jgi:hydroxymethylcytosylglucuronate/cytosylglucuronate synthase
MLASTGDNLLRTWLGFHITTRLAQGKGHLGSGHRETSDDRRRRHLEVFKVMSVQPTFSLLAATRHIGWGGVGKLRLILERLPNARVTLHDNAEMVAITKEFLGPQQSFDANPPSKFDVALVINDPAVANSIADLNVPIVYVDSLPYVHRTEADVPQLGRLAHYCAQKYPIDLFPLTSPLLRAWHDIRWIDPVVPLPQGRRGGRGVVLNVGGLYSYNVAGVSAELINVSVESYLNVVLFPLVDFLLKSGRTISAICGNLNATDCERLRAVVPVSVAVGPQRPQAFERILSGADLLITSPGSTTILQAISIDLPTLLLPSQNRSQLINARVFSKADAEIMQWPGSVLDMAELERMRASGLPAANNYIYRSIVDAAASTERSHEIAAMIRSNVSRAPQDGVLDPRLHALGIAGAEQVARLVGEVALRRH